VEVAAETAILARTDGEPWVVDLSDPAHPLELARLPAVVGRYEGAVIVGDLAYLPVTAPQAGGHLAVVDLSLPGTPTLLGLAEVPLQPTAVAVSSRHAFLVGTPARLLVLDVGEPSSPAVVGELGLGGNGSPTDVAALGHRVYVAQQACPWATPDCFSSLRVVDVSRPDAPTEVRMVRSLSGPLAVTRDHLHVGSGPVLVVLDTADPTALVQVGALDLGEWVRGLALTDRTLFAATGPCLDRFCPAAVRVVDIRDPGNPVLLAVRETPGSASGVALSRGLLLAADGDGGLVVLDAAGCGTPPPRRPAGRLGR
jgi:hypothetical protein